MKNYDPSYNEDEMFLEDEVDEKYVGLIKDAIKKVKVENDKRTKLRKSKQSAETESYKPKDSKRYKSDYNRSKNY